MTKYLGRTRDRGLSNLRLYESDFLRLLEPFLYSKDINR